MENKKDFIGITILFLIGIAFCYLLTVNAEQQDKNIKKDSSVTAVQNLNR